MREEERVEKVEQRARLVVSFEPKVELVGWEEEKVVRVRVIHQMLQLLLLVCVQEYGGDSHTQCHNRYCPRLPTHCLV